MEHADKIPRMTAGPIEDLGVVVNKLVKVGFAHVVGIPGHTADGKQKIILYIDTLFGREIADVPFKTELSLFLSAMQVYLSEKKRYLSRISFLGESLYHITGDLYQDN